MNNTGLRSTISVARDMGISRITLWRWIKDGMLDSVNINGRTYITNESLSTFMRRSKAGEFAKDGAGCLKKRDSK